MGIALIPENSGKLYLNNVIFKNFKEQPPTSEIYLLIRNNEEDSIVKNFFNLNKQIK